jgi:hypothetical protein
MAIVVAEQFKKAFEDARDNNINLASSASAAPHPYVEDKAEEASGSEGEEDGNAPLATETNPPAAKTGEDTREG